MHHGGRVAGDCEALRADLLDPLDPDAVVGDVQVVQDVGRVVLPEHSVDIQQAPEDAGLPWAEERAPPGKWNRQTKQ